MEEPIYYLDDLPLEDEDPPEPTPWKCGDYEEHDWSYIPCSTDASWGFCQRCGRTANFYYEDSVSYGPFMSKEEIDRFIEELP